VLLVDDHPDDLDWLTDLLDLLGVGFVLMTNEEQAQGELRRVLQGDVAYDLAIIDVMLSTADISQLISLDAKYFKNSRESGIRLCEFARNELKIKEEQLPIVCISTIQHEDEGVVTRLKKLEVKILPRTGEPGDKSIRSYLERRYGSTGES
jgi:CheY-like chemotaxis protein